VQEIETECLVLLFNLLLKFAFSQMKPYIMKGNVTCSSSQSTSD